MLSVVDVRDNFVWKRSIVTESHDFTDKFGGFCSMDIDGVGGLAKASLICPRAVIDRPRLESSLR